MRMRVKSEMSWFKLALSIALVSVMLISVGSILAQAKQLIIRNQDDEGIIRVALSGTDTPGCGSIAQPCLTVQYAVNQAVNGDEIRVASGIYTGVNNQGSQSQVVYITKSVTIRGGYSTADWTTPDLENNLTTLDAENDGRVMTIIGPAEVFLEGLRLINGLSTDIGGYYSGNYTCGTTIGRGAGGGLCIQGATVTLNSMRIMTNTATTKGGYGGGIFSSGAILTVTNSMIQNNKAGTGSGNLAYGGGIALYGGQARIEDNDILNNDANPTYEGHGGGVYANNSTALILDNTIQGNKVRGSLSSNQRLGGGGIGVFGAGATIAHNWIVNNSATGYVGGGIGWKEGLINVTANLIFSNTASWGGGMWAGNAPAVVENNVIAGNTASMHGSAVYVNTYNANIPAFCHNTIARNSGGDGSAIFVEANGRVAFTNNIIANHTVGIDGGSATNILLQQTLWDGNDLDTDTLVNEVGHLTGTVAFTGDGYHLTEASAAVDAGIDAGVTTDIDREPRPRGSAPDVGADESPYSHGISGEGLSLKKVALPPRLMTASRTMGGAPIYLLQQEYLIRVANNITDSALFSYLVTDALPDDLEFAAQVHYPLLDFQHSGNALAWQSLAPLGTGEFAWMSVVGNAEAEDGGKVITNTAGVAYTLPDGGSFSKNSKAVSTLPNFPPFIAWPEKGEFCLNREGNVEIRGLAKPNATIKIYESEVFQVQVTTSITGSFYASYQPAQWADDYAVELTAKDCTGGPCGDSSNVVTVRAPDRGWCPQRSYWEKQMGENLFRWSFRNAAGEMATHDWEIPGAFGFNHTTLKIYQCQVPDEGYSVLNISVQADGVPYEDADGPDSNGVWGFSIGAAHNVNFSVIAEDDNTPGSTKTYDSHGSILIDPDGFIFDVTQGLDVISSTLDGVPIEVGNTIAGVTVTAIVSMPQWGGWVPWPAHLYNNQVNPQVTGEDGYFAFFTPPGFYYLEVDEIDGYQSWRSPVVQVITEIVHVNVPYTPWPEGAISQLSMTPDGLSQAVVQVGVGDSVEWVSTLPASSTLIDLARYRENPVLHLKSDLDPLTDLLGWDGGMLIPGGIYRRQFNQSGTYTYTDGAGHSGQVIVFAHIYLPLVIRQ
ncbi:MAG: hypothetical protein JXA42_18945 [Anaerolineales bacterium]|nr:hypothetical protein [Anaerolineales bacterium]